MKKTQSPSNRPLTTCPPTARPLFKNMKIAVTLIARPQLVL